MKKFSYDVDGKQLLYGFVNMYKLSGINFQISGNPERVVFTKFPTGQISELHYLNTCRESNHTMVYLNLQYMATISILITTLKRVNQ